MFIFKATQLRAPAYPDTTPYVDADGTRYSGIPRDLLEELPEPTPPEDYSDETYFRTEQSDAPYVVFTRKPDEMIKDAQRAAKKAQIDTLERQQLMPRATREFMLMFMEANATPEVLAANFGYMAVKAFDEQLKGLRTELNAI